MYITGSGSMVAMDYHMATDLLRNKGPMSLYKTILPIGPNVSL